MLLSELQVFGIYAREYDGALLLMCDCICLWYTLGWDKKVTIIFCTLYHGNLVVRQLKKNSFQVFWLVYEETVGDLFNREFKTSFYFQIVDMLLRNEFFF